MNSSLVSLLSDVVLHTNGGDPKEKDEHIDNVATEVGFIGLEHHFQHDIGWVVANLDLHEN